MTERRQCEALKANGERCGAPPVRGKRVCAGHDPASQRKAVEVSRERRWSLENLPELTDAASAEQFLALVAQLVARGRLKPTLAKELRLLAKDFANVHTSRLASAEFDRLKARVAELEGQREPWR